MNPTVLSLSFNNEQYLAIFLHVPLQFSSTKENVYFPVYPVKVSGWHFISLACAALPSLEPIKCQKVQTITWAWSGFYAHSFQTKWTLCVRVVIAKENWWGFCQSNKVAGGRPQKTKDKKNNKTPISCTRNDRAKVYSLRETVGTSPNLDKLYLVFILLCINNFLRIISLDLELYNYRGQHLRNHRLSQPLAAN